MSHARLLLLPLLLWSTVAYSDFRQTIDRYLVEIAELIENQEAWLGYDTSGRTLDYAFKRANIGYSVRYVQDWSGDLYRDWIALKPI